MKPQAPTLIALSFAIAAAPAAEITLTADPPGPVAVGEEVTIRLGVAGWDPADPEVDAIAFNVDFDPDRLAFVAGSGELVADGSEFLALPNQGPGYLLADDSDDSLVAYGRYIVGCTDIGDATRGSAGPGGALGVFRLLAVAPGEVRVAATSNSPRAVFSDPGYYGIEPAGGVQMGEVDLRVVAGAVTYAGWASGIDWERPGDASPGADPEGDGRSNLLEYFFDADPLAVDPDRSPRSGRVSDGDREYATLAYERPAGALSRSDTRDRGQRSADAEEWRDDVIVHSVGPVDPTTGREPVVLRSAHPLGSERAELLRLEVELRSDLAGGGPAAP